jgi:hypothetical protein
VLYSSSEGVSANRKSDLDHTKVSSAFLVILQVIKLRNLYQPLVTRWHATLEREKVMPRDLGMRKGVDVLAIRGLLNAWHPTFAVLVVRLFRIAEADFEFS